jgi:N-hydroxyarylamine O-acetyltransferase
MESPAAVDLAAYCQRIAYSGSRSPTVDTLRALHLAHATHIPFENLDVLLGRPIRLDLESLQAKLVTARRGGYCFEQNLLFAAVLEQLGFSVTRLGARVRYRTTRILPRTHMLLKVDAEDRSFVVDVGFGGEGLLFPVPLVADEPSPQFVWTYRLIRDGAAFVLQSRHLADWHDLYVFTLEQQFQVDFEMASYYVSTHPDSRFVQTLTAQLPLPEVRHMLRNHQFISERPEGTTETSIADDEQLLRVLSDTFGLTFPAGTRFPVRESREE